MPRQFRKKGILFSLAYFAVSIFPSIPLEPKPGATRIPFKPLNLSTTFFSVISFGMNIFYVNFTFIHSTAVNKRFRNRFYKHQEVQHIFRPADFNRVLRILEFG